jgi:peptidoglycan/xylan/chitin deacetylase (PgdA/CDA1 family)
MYHRFPSGGALTRQLAYIRRYYNPVSLDDVVRCKSEGGSLPTRALAITVDDGYADFQTAWAEFQTFHLPATLFVVSGFVNRELWLWPDVVAYCIRRSPLQRIVVELPGGVLNRTVNTVEERQSADRELDRLLLAMPDEVRRDIVAELPDSTGVSLPAAVPEEYAPLRWEDLARMANEGLSVGAHTQTHPVLARIASRERLQQEITSSKLTVESHLQRPVHHFCYPNGQEQDINPGTVEAVRQAGFLSASTAQRGLVGPETSLLELRRIGVDPHMPLDLFELELAGFRMS